jgi:Na+-transporting NADH:ubiquinone oxidoreductase subunit F
MTEILIGVVLFTGVLTSITLAVLAVRAKMMPAGKANLTINQSHTVKVNQGCKLLESLVANDIHVPSACGGSGTCGQCRLVVSQGAPPLLPTEAALINRSDADSGWRLACQLTVAGDMTIVLPESILGVEQRTCRVHSNHNVATFIKELVLDMPPGERLDFRAGSYIQLHCPSYDLDFSTLDIEARYRADWERLGLLRLHAHSSTPAVRAYSLASHPGEAERLTLNVRIATPPPSLPGSVPPGVVSSWIFSLKAGDPVTISGPYGNFHARDGAAEMVFIGGGAGMAPLRSIIFDQLCNRKTERYISFWYGARNLNEAFYVDDFDRLAKDHQNFTWQLALSHALPEENWTGPTGFIHDIVFKHYLGEHVEPESCEYYLCGPPLMIAATRKMLYDLGVDDESILFDDFGG